jgi:DNA-binding NarL/FixJ family response regulator
MTSNDFSNLLIVGEGRSIYRFLSNTHCNLSITEAAATNKAESGNGFYEIIIVDLETLSEAGIELMEKAVRNCPHTKIIALESSEMHDKRQSFGLNIFRYLEKPINSNLLSYTVQHALDVLARERIINDMAEKLKLSDEELGTQRVQLEYLNQKLTDNDVLLSQLADALQRERKQVEKRIALNLRCIIIPAIDKLKKIKGLEPYLSELELMVSGIEDVTSDFMIDARVAYKLTTAELRVASLIKNGFSTDEIARKLNISTDTIRSHRKSIRKRLGISQSMYSLRNYLESKVNGNNNNHAPSIRTKI